MARVDNDSYCDISTTKRLHVASVDYSASSQVALATLGDEKAPGYWERRTSLEKRLSVLIVVCLLVAGGTVVAAAVIGNSKNTGKFKLTVNPQHG